MKIRFEVEDQDLRVFGPDGREFERPDQIILERYAAERERDEAERERDEAERERDEAERERDEVKHRVALLTAKLRELGIDPDQMN